MGGELLGSLPDEPKKRVSMAEIFWDAYPAYLSMGMSDDEYWNGDARACRAYRKKREVEFKLQDEKLWRQGAYLYEALIAVAPYFNSIKPHKPEDYGMPFSYREEQEKKKREQQNQINRTVAIFQSWAINYNEQRKKLKEKQDGEHST